MVPGNSMDLCLDYLGSLQLSIRLQELNIDKELEVRFVRVNEGGFS
jgi:hypothetical protein